MPRFVTGVVASAALLAAALFAPAAQAAPCDGVGMQQPFLAWHDSADYVLVDGGDFETDAAGWTLDGAATTVAGGNSLRPESSASSLGLPAGSAATSPPICVSKGNPTARLFAQAPVTGKKKARIKVDVLYLNPDGSVRKVKTAGRVKAKSEWAPTRKFSLAQGQFNHAKPEEPGSNGHGGPKPEGHGGPKPGEGDSARSAQIALRFTPRDTEVRIDDVFVDPRLRR